MAGYSKATRYMTLTCLPTLKLCLSSSSFNPMGPYLLFKKFSAKVSPKSTLSEHPALYDVVVPASVGGKSSSSSVSQLHEDNTPCAQPFATVWAIAATDRACTNAASLYATEVKEGEKSIIVLFSH